MRGVGRSGHSRGLQIFVRQAGSYANPAGALHNILRERATENDTTVDLPCQSSSRGEATEASGRLPLPRVGGFPSLASQAHDDGYGFAAGAVVRDHAARHAQ